MAIHLSFPCPFVCLGPVDYSHPRANSSLHSSHSAMGRTINIRRYYECRPLHSPLSHCIPYFYQPYCFNWSAAARALMVLLVSICARTKKMAHFLHPYIGCECRKLTLISSWISRRLIMFIFGKLSPQPAEYAISRSREIRRDGVGRRCG